MNIAPAEVEGLVSGHPAVAEVAVFGVPDDVLGERVAAVVALKPEHSLDLDELTAFLTEKQVATYKFPERHKQQPRRVRLAFMRKNQDTAAPALPSHGGGLLVVPPVLVNRRW